MSERYEIQEKIGQGGIGAVYRAYDTQLKRSVAIKRMLPSDEGVNGANSVEMILKEATTLSALQHPNIITVYDMGVDDEGAFVVMELLKGETLDQVIEHGVLTMRDFNEVVSQTMEALIAAEDAGVLHRDLKPTNVMVNWLPSKKFQVKILDFSLAKFSRTPAPQTIDQGDAIFGSIYFMAPEQFERGDLDKRTDLYSMGCLYYFCLAGQYPFQGESAAQVMASHLQGTVIPLEQIRPDLPPVICQWVMWLINRYAKDRPQDSKEAFENYQHLTEAIDLGTNRVPLSGPHIATPLNATSRRLIVPPLRKTTAVNRLPTGAVSTMPSAEKGELGESADHGEVTFMPGKETSMLVYLAIGLGALVFLALVLGAKFFLQNQAVDRLEALAGQASPMGYVADVPLLARFLDGDVRDVNAVSARKVLNRLQDGTGSPAAINAAVVKALKEASKPKVQVNLIKVIYQREILSAEETLIEITATNEEPEVTKEAMIALAEFGDEQTFVALLDNIQGEYQARLPSEFEPTLIKIGQGIQDKTAVAKRLAEIINQKSGSIRLPLMRLLGSLGGEEALLVIKEAFVSEEKAERQLALASLANWPERSTEVADLARSAFEKAERVQALEAYLALTLRPGTEPKVDAMVDTLLSKLLNEDRSLDTFRDKFLNALLELEDRDLAISMAMKMARTPSLAPNITEYATRIYKRLTEPLDH